MQPNRLYLFISQINKMIIQTTDLETLFKEACRIVVEVGQFRMAWIGILNEATQKIYPVAHFGDDKDFPLIIPNLSISDDPQERGPAGTAIKQGKYLVCNDLENDPLLKPWRTEAIKRGYRSTISLPIIKFEKVIGVFSIYTSQINFFDEVEISLLNEVAHDITFAIENIEKEQLRINAQLAILEKEKRYHTLTEISPVGIFYTNETGFTTYVNKFWCTLADINFDEALGDGWLNAMHPLDRDRISQDWNQAKGKMETSISEYRFLKKDGTITWVMGQAIPERNAANEIIGYVGTTTDITDRKKAEQAISLREEKYRTLIENASDGIFLSDDSGNFIEVNSRAASMMGYTAVELTNLSFKDLVIVDENFIPFRFEELKAGKSILQKRTLLRKDGTIVIGEISAKQLPDGNILSIVRDLTERIQIERKLQLEKDLSDKIINSLPGIFYLSDPTPRLLRWNQTFEDVSGYTAEELATKIPISLFVEEDHIKMRKSIEKTYHEGSADIEVRLLSKKGNTIPYYFTGVRIEYMGKPAMLGTGINISERLRVEQDLKESEEKYRTLVEQASDAIFIADAHGKFINVNPSACNLSRYSEAELLQMTIFDFAVTEDLELHPFHFEALKKGQSVITERFMKGRDGVIRDIEVTAKQLSDGRLLAFIRDISARKNVEREIIKEKNLSDTIINTMPGIFYLFNSEGKYIRWNNNFEKVTGYNKSEIAHIQPIDLIIEEEKEMLRDCINKVFVNGSNSIQAFLQLKSKEKIPYYFSGIAIEYEGQSCIVGVGIDFSERIKVQKEIEETSSRLRELTAHLIDVREEERKRIGREIHDELGQQLTAIKMDVSWIDKQIKDDNEIIKTKLKKIIKLLDGSNQSIRRILNELRPYILDNYGLSEAIMWLGEQFTENTGIPVLFSTDEFDSKLPETVATCVFRIYQEALTNITRYASAQKVQTTLKICDNAISLQIEDDGKGFEPHLLKTEKKFGILGMKERVYALGGNFEIVTALGEGTKILILLPLIKDSSKINS